MRDELREAAEQQPDKLLDHLRAFIEGIEDRPVLPSQFFESQEAPSPPGEKKIRYKMLKEAVREFRKTAFATSKAGVRKHRETYEWIIENNYEWPYSFVNLCEVFGINAESARAALWQWKEREKERRYDAKAAQAREGAGPECCPSLPPQGGTDEGSSGAEGRGSQHAA